MRVLVVLGAAVWPGGEPSPTLLRRCNAAIALWHRGGFDLVIPSGGVGRHPPAEAEVMARLLREGGVPAGSIRPEPRAATTMETAENVLRMLEDGTADIVAVTDGYHALRTRIAFRAWGRDVQIASAARAEPRPRLRVTARQWLRETLALPFYLVRAALIRRRLAAGRP